ERVWGRQVFEGGLDGGFGGGVGVHRAGQGGLDGGGVGVGVELQGGHADGVFVGDGCRVGGLARYRGIQALLGGFGDHAGAVVVDLEGLGEGVGLLRGEKALGGADGPLGGGGGVAAAVQGVGDEEGFRADLVEAGAHRVAGF